MAARNDVAGVAAGAQPGGEAAELRSPPGEDHGQARNGGVGRKDLGQRRLRILFGIKRYNVHPMALGLK